MIPQPKLVLARHRSRITFIARNDEAIELIGGIRKETTALNAYNLRASYIVQGAKIKNFGYVEDALNFGYNCRYRPEVA